MPCYQLRVSTSIVFSVADPTRKISTTHHECRPKHVEAQEQPLSCQSKLMYDHLHGTWRWAWSELRNSSNKKKLLLQLAGQPNSPFFAGFIKLHNGRLLNLISEGGARLVGVVGWLAIFFAWGSGGKCSRGILKNIVQNQLICLLSDPFSVGLHLSSGINTFGTFHGNPGEWCGSLFHGLWKNPRITGLAFHPFIYGK